MLRTAEAIRFPVTHDYRDNAGQSRQRSLQSGNDMDGPSPGGGATRPASVESKASWRTAWLILAILSVSFGSSLLIVVGMKPIQESLGTDRSVVALAGAFLWVGTGAGGIF